MREALEEANLPPSVVNLADETARDLTRGDSTRAYERLASAAVDRAGRRWRPSLNALLAGRPEEAIQTSVRRLLRDEGLSEGSIARLVDSGDVEQAVRYELQLLMNINHTEWRRLMNGEVPESTLRRIQRELQGHARYGDLIQRIPDDPVGALEEMMQRYEDDLVASVGNSEESLRNGLRDLQDPQTQRRLAEGFFRESIDQLPQAYRQLLDDGLEPLMDGNRDEASRRALGALLRDLPHSDELIEGDLGSYTEELETSVRQSLDEVFTNDQLTAILDGDAGESGQLLLDTFLQDSGFSQESIRLISDGDFEAALRLEADARRPTLTEEPAAVLARAERAAWRAQVIRDLQTLSLARQAQIYGFGRR